MAGNLDILTSGLSRTDCYTCYQSKSQTEKNNGKLTDCIVTVVITGGLFTGAAGHVIRADSQLRQLTRASGTTQRDVEQVSVGMACRREQPWTIHLMYTGTNHT